MLEMVSSRRSWELRDGDGVGEEGSEEEGVEECGEEHVWGMSRLDDRKLGEGRGGGVCRCDIVLWLRDEMRSRELRRNVEMKHRDKDV